MGMKITQVPLLNGVAATANRTSETIDIRGLVLGSFHIITTGTAVGSFAVDFSNAPAGASMADSTDTDFLAQLDAARTDVMNGTAGVHIVENVPLSAAYMRFRYVHGSSTGTLTVHFVGKE